MKKKEWNEGLNHIDSDLVEKYVEQKERLNKSNLNKRKKSRALAIRVIAIAASLSLIIGAVVFAFVMQRDEPLEPDGNISGDKVETDAVGGANKDGEDNADADLEEPNYDYGGNVEGDGPSPNSPVEHEYNQQVAPEQTLPSNSQPSGDEPALPNDDWTAVSTEDAAPIAELLGDEYSNYEFSWEVCSTDKVGEEFGDIKVKIGYGSDWSDLEAKTYKLAGVDSEFALCLKFIGENEYFDSNAYHIIRAKVFKFNSLDDMREKLLGDGTLKLPYSVEYYKNTQEVYCDSFVLNYSTSALRELILSGKGYAVDTQGGLKPESVHAEANEYISASCSFDSRLSFSFGTLRIYDTGYAYFTFFGGQLFDIGVENAKKVIDQIVTQGEPEGYFWNEIDGKWYPKNSDKNAQYSSFLVALEETKLYGQIYFDEQVSHISRLYQGDYPKELKLDRKRLLAIAEILSDADGYAIDVGEEIENLSDVSITFLHLWDTEKTDTVEITVYDVGYVELLGTYYFIGTNYTDKIINTVRMTCDNEQGYYWDKKDGLWKLSGESEGENAETSPETESDTEA